MDKLRALETFIAVADSEGFAQAARQLNVSAATVTRLVGELEAELGVTLLTRTTRQVTLTAVGQRYLEQAKGILAELQNADDTARGATSNPTGLLRITAPTMFGQMYITPIIAAYAKQYPDVSIDAIFQDSIVNVIDEGIDVAIRIGELPDSSLIAKEVARVQFKVCGSPDYLREASQLTTPADLPKHKTIGLALGGYPSDWLFANGERIKPNHQITFNTIPAGISAAVGGWGLVRVLSYQIAPELAAGKLVTVLDSNAPPSIPINVLHGQGRRSSANVRAFIDFAVANLRDNPMLTEKV